MSRMGASQCNPLFPSSIFLSWSLVEQDLLLFVLSDQCTCSSQVEEVLGKLDGLHPALSQQNALSIEIGTPGDPTKTP